MLHLTIGGAGDPAAADVAPAFLAVAAVTLLAVPVFLRLPDSAGAEVSGRRAKAPRAAAAE